MFYAYQSITQMFTFLPAAGVKVGVSCGGKGEGVGGGGKERRGVEGGGGAVLSAYALSSCQAML